MPDIDQLKSISGKSKFCTKRILCLLPGWNSGCTRPDKGFTDHTQAGSCGNFHLIVVIFKLNLAIIGFTRLRHINLATFVDFCTWVIFKI